MEDTLQDALKSQPSLLPRWKQDYRATLHYVIQMMVHVILSYPRARAMPRTYACTCTRFVSFPDPPQKVERGYVWCSERQLLSQRAGPYFVKNVIIAFLYPELEFLTPQSIWTTTQSSFQKLKTAAKSIGTAENSLRDKFSLFLICFKIRSLMSCNHN